MCAFRITWRFAGTYLHVNWAHLYLVAADTRSSQIYCMLNTCEDNVGSERNQVFNFPSEIAVAVGRMPFRSCICMF